MTYQRAGGDKRGNTKDRFARKTWLLFTFGDGVHVACTHCHKSLTRQTLEADRIEPGASYCHLNIQPSCRACNVARSDNEEWSPDDTSWGVEF
jgi:hypothetical protein